jgi:UTP--glucose-1-phosphate uridylyltransferase
MEIKKAVVTAAGQNQRTLPLQSLVDRDGSSKTALCIIIEEILQAGIDEICLVIHPGDHAAYTAAAGPHVGRLHFVEQSAPLGYGHAVHCARDFTGATSFLLLVGDHLYLSGAAQRCAQQLVAVATVERCAVSAVQATHESKLPYYGAVGGRLLANRKGLYEITEVLEKATPTVAEQKLIVPGLRAGHYLCFFGMHVLTPVVMDTLGQAVEAAKGQGGVTLSAALAKLAARERYLASELQGRRYDIGVKYGLLTAQLALALDGKDREEVLASLVELLAVRSK